MEYKSMKNLLANLRSVFAENPTAELKVADIPAQLIVGFSAHIGHQIIGEWTIRVANMKISVLDEKDDLIVKNYFDTKSAWQRAKNALIIG
jgi:hypothetical protein